MASASFVPGATVSQTGFHAIFLREREALDECWAMSEEQAGWISQQEFQADVCAAQSDTNALESLCTLATATAAAVAIMVVQQWQACWYSNQSKSALKRGACASTVPHQGSSVAFAACVGHLLLGKVAGWYPFISAP